MRLASFVAGMVFLSCDGALAADVGPDLYTAQTIVTGTDMRNRPSGFGFCLRDVLVKVSGNPRLADDPRVTSLAENAEQWVATFDYRDRMSGIPRHDEQGSRDRPYDLSVRFDPAKIDQTLAALGERPWAADRPTLRPVLRVRNGQGRTYVLRATESDGKEQRESLASAATRYGLPLTLPGEDGKTSADLSDKNKTVPLQGTLVWTEKAGGWVGSWRLVWEKRRYAWSVRGVSFDEAFRNMIRGCLLILSRHGAPATDK